MQIGDLDLSSTERALAAAKRRRAWMEGVASALRERGLVARAADRQEAHFSAMTAALRRHREHIEDQALSTDIGSSQD